MYQKDYNHDTPLHIAARFYEGVNLLRQFFNYWYTKKEENDDMLDLEVPPWKVKNLKGNTPLHEAARTCCLFGLLQMADQFLKSTRDLNEAFSEVNNNGETALHLIATFMRKPKSHIERAIGSEVPLDTNNE
ncbi:NF-kappa-B inhibitor alpha [Bienertia sinuspersici]